MLPTNRRKALSGFTIHRMLWRSAQMILYKLPNDEMHFYALQRRVCQQAQLTRVKNIWNLQFIKSGLVAVFGLTSFLAAALLFSVQPLIGKMALPVLGGTPAVWTTCLVYFQVMLFGGYLFAHGIQPTPGAEPRRASIPYLMGLALLLVVGFA